MCYKKDLASTLLWLHTKCAWNSCSLRQPTQIYYRFFMETWKWVMGGETIFKFCEIPSGLSWLPKSSERKHDRHNTRMGERT